MSLPPEIVDRIASSKAGWADSLDQLADLIDVYRWRKDLVEIAALANNVLKKQGFQACRAAIERHQMTEEERRASHANTIYWLFWELIDVTRVDHQQDLWEFARNFRARAEAFRQNPAVRGT